MLAVRARSRAGPISHAIRPHTDEVSGMGSCLSGGAVPSWLAMPCWRHMPSEWAPFDTALETALDATSGAAPDTAPGAAPKAAPKAVVKPLAAAPEASRCCCACTRRRSCNACNAARVLQQRQLVLEARYGVGFLWIVGAELRQYLYFRTSEASQLHT